jgi:hypothetical protein
MLIYKLLYFVRNEFRLRDQIMLAIITFCLVVLVVGLLLLMIPALEDDAWVMMAVAQSVAEWTGLVLLVSHGTILKSGYRWYILASVFIVGCSFLFKILHLPGADQMMVLGFLFFEIVYTIRFVRQRYTGITGWFKYLWICSWCVATVGTILHRLPPEFDLVPAILFWITIAFFLREKRRVAVKYKGLEA